MPGPQPIADVDSKGGDGADPLIGRTLNDRYRIVEQIGSGGMGRVYKAVQAPLDRMVALKVLGAGHDRDPNFYKRFFLEASVTAKLTHPNTITVYDYGRTEDGIFFIAMEFLAGRTLSQAMQADGPLAQERVIHIAQQICRACGKRTRWASSTATSSPPTSCSCGSRTITTSSRCSTSAW